MNNNLKEVYKKDIVPALMEKNSYTNVNAVPKIEKIIVSMGVGDAVENSKWLDAAAHDLALITGQKPYITKAKKSVASFKVREGAPIGVKVTLRNQNMYDFLFKLINVALPQVRDFRGISPNGFDGRGNYTLGITEQLIFPEIDFDKVAKVRGMNITFVTSAKTDKEARDLLEAFGLPFRSK